jgi:branched-chain amino acid transport system permease protein
VVERSSIRIDPRRAAVAGATLLAAGLAPTYLATGDLRTFTRILVLALLAASLDLLVGTSGMPSLGHAAFYAVGGYTAARVGLHLTTNGPAQLALAMLAGFVAAAATGWMVVRTRGTPFLMLTLAVGSIAATLAGTWDRVTGGDAGLVPVPPVQVLPGTGQLDGPAEKFFYVLGGFVLGVTLLRVCVGSAIGRALRGIRDNEERMRAIGYPTYWLKYAAFCIAGAVAGAAGALLVAYDNGVSDAAAGFERSVYALIAVVIGGAGSLWGPCVGAAVIVIATEEIGINLGGYGPMLLGLVLIGCVYVFPRGIAGIRLPRRWLRSSS